MKEDNNFNTGLKDYTYFKEVFNEIQKAEVCDPAHKENLRENLATYIREKQIKDYIQERRQKSFFKTPVFRLAFSFSLIILFVFSSILIYLSFPQTGSVICSPKAITGEVLIQKQDLARMQAEEGNPLKSGDIVTTLENSQVTLNVGEETNVRLGETTEVKILSLKKKKIQQINMIYLSRGSINCNVYLPNKKSVFKIITDLATYSVKSTSFCLTRHEEGDLELQVKEGIVEVVLSIHQDMITQDLKKIDEDIYKAMAAFCDKRFFCTDERSLLLHKTEVDSLFSEAKLIEKEIFKTFKDTGSFSHENKKKYIRRIQLIEEKQNILIIKREQDENVYEQEKLIQEKDRIPEISEKDKADATQECTENNRQVYKERNEEDILPATGSNVRIETQQGNIIKGKMIEKDAESGIKVNTALGEIYLPHRIIKSINTY